MYLRFAIGKYSGNTRSKEYFIASIAKYVYCLNRCFVDIFSVFLYKYIITEKLLYKSSYIDEKYNAIKCDSLKLFLFFSNNYLYIYLMILFPPPPSLSLYLSRFVPPPPSLHIPYNRYSVIDKYNFRLRFYYWQYCNIKSREESLVKSF